MRSLAITEVSPPNYAQPGLGAESGEFYVPPTTHLIATVEDLTDMLDYASKNIDGMDDDARAEPGQNPPITARWTATSTYDVYMVDTPEKKDEDGTQDPIKDKPVEAPPKHRCQRCRSKSRRKKDSNTGAEDNNTLDNTEDQEAPVEPQSEQDEWEDGQVDPDDPIRNKGSEDGSYLPISEEDESLGDEEFIVPEEPFEQERFKRRLISMARSLKRKQQQLQAG